MTKCNKDETDLKSTAYNQTGENFFSQLSAYNSMSSHLRRVLLARSVVDARTQSYLRRGRGPRKTADRKTRTLKKAVPSDMIDRLAYDTRHHPADITRINLDTRYPCEREEKCLVDSYDDCDAGCSRSRTLTERTYCEEGDRAHWQKHGSTSRSNRSAPARKMKSADVKHPPLGNRDFLSEESHDEDNEESPRRREQTNGSRRTERERDEDDARYAEFVYGITREIMRNGLYTDEELQDVFKKHLDRHKGSKMLYEIYQLKVSLNVSDDSDMDDELEDLIHAQRLLSVSEIRPPTPPKILDENKVIEKLMSYQRVAGDRRRSSAGRNKSVLLVDANPELLVTERDVLTSLMEADIDPKQAQQICKSLFHKSRDTFVTDAVQAEANRANERLTNAEDGRSDWHFEKSCGVQEKSCTTTDLLVKEDKNVQAHGEESS